MRGLILAALVLGGCGDDSVSRDAGGDGQAEGGTDDAARDAPRMDAGTSCVPGQVLHAPGDGGVLGRDLLVSAEADGSVREAEPAIAASDQNAAVVAYVANDESGVNYIGTARIDSAGAASAPTPPMFGFGGSGATRQSMPSLAYALGAHRFYLSWLSYDPDPSGLPKNASVQVAVSDDDGMSWQAPVRADDPNDSVNLPGLGPDKPWLAISPRDGSAWVVYRSGADALIRVTASSSQQPPQFGSSIRVFDPNNLPPNADPDLAIGANGRPRIVVADSGDVIVTWIHIIGDVSGSDRNSVQLARMPQGLGAFGTPITVSANSERVVFDDAPVVVGPGGATLFVAYVVNLASTQPVMDAFEVRIARSVDGVTFTTRASPAGDPGAFDNGCVVTRMRPALALQQTGVQRLHVAFYDDRYGSGDPGLGAFVYTYTDSTGYQAVQFLNDADFPESTVQSGPLWLGDYTSLALTPGTASPRHLFAAWTDTRSGVGHIAVAAGLAP